MLFVALLHQGHKVCTRLKCTHHASRRLMEHAVRHMVEQVTLELKVDCEVYTGLLADRCEGPGIGQVLQRALDGSDYDLPWSIQRYLAGEALLEWAEADVEVGDDLPRVRLADAGAAAPGHERRVLLHVCNHRK